MACSNPAATRTYPLRKPPNHTLPVPRYTAILPPSTTHIHTLYIGLQIHSSSSEATTTAEQVQQRIEQHLHDNTHETFTLLDPAGGEPPGSRVWVCYQTSTSSPSSSPAPPSLPPNLEATWRALPPPARNAIGLWAESFTTPLSRLETNYSGTDYLPGVARVPGARVEQHELATYWGAARDRIPEAAHDLFPRALEAGGHGGDVEEGGGEGVGRISRGTNAHNVVHIRSGQWWAQCGREERDAYEGKLEPALRAGLRYLNEHRGETGCMGIRYLRNGGGEERRDETCGAGFFHNLEDLERWSKTHSSHLKIWRGALAHYKAFPENRRLRTWHEVSVIREGDARWEYINCKGETGVMGCVRLESEVLEK